MRKITREEWDSTHEDYKTTIKGQRYLLMLETDGVTRLVPVKIRESKGKAVQSG